MIIMAKYAVTIKERKSPVLITAKDSRSAKRSAKKMGLTPKKATRLITFTK